jgi:hypothetical protein
LVYQKSVDKQKRHR